MLSFIIIILQIKQIDLFLSKCLIKSGKTFYFAWYITNKQPNTNIWVVSIITVVYL